MFKKVILTISLCALISACGFEIYQSGDLPPSSVLAVVKPGKTKEQVLRMLGTPAFEVVETNTLAYVRQIKENRAFLEPKETERDVYVYTFNKKNVLETVDHLTLADAVSVRYDRKATPTQKKELSVTEQIVKNFGRYDAGGRDSSDRI